MFVEQNSINGIVVSIDALFRPTAKRKAAIIEEVISCAKGNHLIALVSTYTKSQFNNASTNIIRKIRQNQSDLQAEIFFAENLMEQIGPTNQLLRALRSMEERSCSTIFFTCQSRDISAANECHVGTVLVCTSEDDEKDALEAGADFTCGTTEEVQQILNGQRIGYLGELIAMPFLPIYVKPICQWTATYYQYRYDPAYSEVIVTGRYFKSSDPRFNKHALSGSLLDAKNNHNRHRYKFGKIIGQAASIVTSDEYDLITRVPPKPNSVSDPLGDYIVAATSIGELEEAKIDLDVITCARDYQPQRFAGSYEDRRQNVEGVFGIRGNLTGRRAILVDDILTSGSTIRSATDSLMEAGCTEVTPLVIAVHPNKNPIDKAVNLICEQCGSILRQRFNKKNGQIFWGCENYPDCRETMQFLHGLEILNDFTGEEVSSRGYIEDIPL